MVNPLDANSVFNATGACDAVFTNSLIYFFRLLDSNALGVAVPPRPRIVCTCNERLEHRHLEDNELIIDFYLACTLHEDSRVRDVSWVALEACSFQLSSAPVERSFATLTNHQHCTTLKAKDRYLRNLTMFTVNKVHLVNMYREPMRELAAKLGY